MASFYSVGTLAAASALLLTGCAVYAPTIPSTPLLEARQVEVTASLRGITALEASAAWSPAPHWLLLGESALQGGTTTTTTNNVTTTYHDYHRQVGLGVGVYRAPTSQSGWYAAAVGGVGFAKVSLHSVDVGIVSPYVPLPFPYVAGYYEANYQRYYGQLYAAQSLSERLTGGLSLRSTYVHYTRLTFESQDIEPANQVFIEPTFFLRLGQGPVRGQATLGLSVPTASGASRELNKRTAPISGLFSVGVIFRPDLLRWRQKD